MLIRTVQFECKSNNQFPYGYKICNNRNIKNNNVIVIITAKLKIAQSHGIGKQAFKNHSITLGDR